MTKKLLVVFATENYKRLNYNVIIKWVVNIFQHMEVLTILK